MAANSTLDASESEVDYFNDKELESYLASEEFQIDEKKDTSFKCLYCPKVCLSKRGMTRHVNCKHPEKSVQKPKQQQKVTAEEILPLDKFKTILGNCLAILSKDECYPTEITSSFNVNHHDVSPYYETLYDVIKPLVVSFKLKGDAEKFYPSFLSTVTEAMFPGLDGFCSNVLRYELANHVLAFLSKAKLVNNTIEFELTETNFTDKDLHIINYLSGCVVGTFYRRVRFKMDPCDYQKDCLILLDAFRFKEGGAQTDTREHKLIDVRNRGGLWKVRKGGVTLFKICETYFVSATKDFVTNIDANLLAEMMIQDPMVLSQFGTIFKSCDPQIKREVGMNLLEEMLIFYFRLRSFSYAKQQQQKHKMKKHPIVKDHYGVILKNHVQILEGLI
eukprot:TCONS_00006716-protein